MDKVFIVTSGCYSDYQIEAVFSSEERAKEYINAKGTDCDWEISEYIVDSESVDKVNAMYEVYIDINTGEVTVYGRCGQGTGWDYSYYSERRDCILYDGYKDVRMWIESDSMERVKKVASERWMQVKALQQVAFPYLYKKVVDDRKHFGLPCHEYPMYNFFTKKIILAETQKLDISYAE